ncbi:MULTISPECIES: c-type cytochrome [Kordiimonas]|jgi:cytochrome c556|uniref:c-type cytochrome n=1 Tax=Kordiimonas TaxID=288021 RepID=UPI0025807612|nr:cytochrome c [Kordiimonas sp. UBA4487]
MNKTVLTGLATAALMLGTALPAFSHGDDRFHESQVRHDVMEVFGKGFGKISKIMKGEEGSPADFPAIAADMADAASKTKASFEKDTRGMHGFTEAKDNIWENWDDFAERLDKMETDAQAFLAAANSGDMAQIGPAMKELGSNCKSCHDKYKADLD